MSTTASSTTLDPQLHEQILNKVESFMEQMLQQRLFPTNLRDAMAYSLLAPGKRVRPVLVMLTARALGGDEQLALSPAASIEMIHAFSLIHDDLPAMDDDDLRRGRPTLHKHTNEAMAILAGDALSTLAVETIAGTISDHALAGRLIYELTTATNDMVAGQVYDTFQVFDEAELDDLEKLKLIHRHKTGALIRCSCRMGAIVAGASEEQLLKLTTYGQAMGLMFQVVDDVLDVTQSTEELGKTAGKDIEQDKMTYPALMGLEKSREQVQTLREVALEALAELGESAQPLRALCETMATRTK